MTRSQKLALRQREIRSRLSEIADLEGDALTDAIRSEGETLDKEYRDVETRLSAAVIAEGAGDGERTDPTDPTDPADREYRTLLGRSNVGPVLSAVMGGRLADGPEAELQQHHKLAPNEIPVELLRAREHRAAGVTTAPGDVGAMEDTVTPPVFATGDGAFLGVERPTVASGDAVYPVLTNRPTVGGPHDDSTDVAETAGTWGADLLAPERIQASYLFRRTDSARFSGMENALRSALNMGLEEKLDYEAMRGTNGLLTGTNLANNNVSAVTTFAKYISEFIYSRVDGRYAMTPADLRACVGSGTFAHMGSVYRANNVDDPVAEIVNRRTAGLRVSANVAAVNANKQNAVIRLGSQRFMVQPMWENVGLIVDEVTGSGAGTIEVTAVLLMNTKIVRAANAYKQQTQHA